MVPKWPSEGSKTCIFQGFRVQTLVKMRHFSFKMLHFSFTMLHFSFKMFHFSFKMHHFSFKMRHFNFKMHHSGFKMHPFSLKLFHFTFKMVICGLEMANLSFQRVPGQDLAENGPFAFKPQKEFIKKNTAFVLENLTTEIVKMLNAAF